MNKADLERRTRRFAVGIIEFVSALPRDRAGDAVGRQPLRSGTSVGANYREANRAHSRSDFIHKIGTVEREAAETLYWLELCEDVSFGDSEWRATLQKESGEFVAIFTRVEKTTRFGSPSVNPKFEFKNSRSPSPNPQSAIRNPKS